MSEPARRHRSALSWAIGLLGAAVLVAVVAVLASTPTPPPDRVQELAERLRCPVCVSVSVADSPSESAQAMREVITEQVAAGRTDAEIEAYFRTRYGDWAVIDPPASGRTLPLWVLPGLVVVGGVAAVAVRAFRRDREPDELTEVQRDRVRKAVAERCPAPHDPGERG